MKYMFPQTFSSCNILPKLEWRNCSILPLGKALCANYFCLAYSTLSNKQANLCKISPGHWCLDNNYWNEHSR